MKVNIAHILISIAMLVPFVLGQEPIKDKCSGTKLEATLNKTSFVLLEPIVADLTLAPANINRKHPFRNIKIRIWSNGNMRSFDRITHFITKIDPELMPRSQRVTVLDDPALTPINSKQRVFRDFAVVERVKAFFPKAGTYTLQFFLEDIENKCEIGSNVSTIQITDPKGVDFTAFSLLAKYKTPLGFNWVWETKDGIASLESFIRDTEGSVYTEYAVAFLGNVYLMKGELDKARDQFVKIEKSSNKVISTQAKTALEKIRIDP
ncbi:MAG: hypothetical protein OEQ39_26995 [Gammaproteobacteria bacterium]|nr:hypothetical protein [Gammaproteobacteria bacterium]